MRKATSVVSLLIISTTACFSLNGEEENMITETREVPAFSSIILNGMSTVRIHEGPQSVQVTMSEDYIDRYETKVKDHTLLIGLKCSIGFFFKPRKNLGTCEVDITVPELDGITVNGKGFVTADMFSCESLKLDLNGTGSIEIRGTVSNLTVLCSGAGTVSAAELTADTALVKMTGSCRVEVGVEGTLDASITGAGELIYRGNPTISQSVTGSGGLRRADS